MNIKDIKVRNTSGRAVNVDELFINAFDHIQE